MLDHPENDLLTDADFTNMLRPEPRNFDDLADAPDPLVVAEANQRSTRQAIWWAVGTPIVTIIVACLLGVVARMLGGELCEAGNATWICSRSAEIWWPIATSVVPVASLFGTAIIMYRKLISYTRWRPWMGTFWFVVPFSMLWMTTTFQIAIVHH